MALQRFDRVAETTTTTGTGTYDLAGAIPGFQAFVSRVTSGNTVEYCCAAGTDFEIGIGTFTDATPDNLARTTILASSNGDAAVNWGAGTKNIFITPLASRFLPGLVNEVAYNTAAGVLGFSAYLSYDGTDMFIRGKLDLGEPGGVTGGLDIGEGGSYSADKDGTTIVKAFSYDASAASGSRFTELTLTAENTLLAASGDRIYVGSTSKYWAMRFTIGVANSVSDETLLGFYWDGSALASAAIMGVLKDSSTSLADRVLEQTTEQEYVTFDKAIDADWAAADNQLDTIPNAGANYFWFCLQVPASGLTTAPRVDEIKARGSDTDFVTGTAQQVHWGKARVQKISTAANFVDRSAAQPAITDFAITAGITSPVFALRNNQSDGVDGIFRLPSGIDTSSRLAVTLDWFATATGGCEFDFHYKIVKQGTALGGGESDTATITITITPSAANAAQTDDALLTAAQYIDVSACNAGDVIFFTLVRDGSSDANAGVVHPDQINFKYVEWTLGDLV